LSLVVKGLSTCLGCLLKWAQVLLISILGHTISQSPFREHVMDH